MSIEMKADGAIFQTATMTFDEAVKNAIKCKTLTEALAYAAVWESGRSIRKIVNKDYVKMPEGAGGGLGKHGTPAGQMTIIIGSTGGAGNPGVNSAYSEHAASSLGGSGGDTIFTTGYGGGGGSVAADTRLAGGGGASGPGYGGMGDNTYYNFIISTVIEAWEKELINKACKLHPHLIDREDGENRAVRSFLALYSNPGSITVCRMKNHMAESGWDKCWPEWVDEKEAQGTLTKSGAGDWLRYLFSLETPK